MTIKYVTELHRFLGNQGGVRVFEGVRATVSEKPHDEVAKEQTFSPGEWRDLMRGGDVMYRYRDEAYARP